MYTREENTKAQVNRWKNDSLTRKIKLTLSF